VVTRARVFVATTEGPSEIQHIIEEDPEVRSVICLNGTSEALPVSRDYESFVRKPTGVVERLFGHPSYRVDVSRRISNGQSWQLGMLVAHALHAEGRLATKDETANEVYWVTGEVRHSLDVMAIDHIRDKLRQSETLFDELARLQTKLTILVPANNREEAEAEFHALGPNMPDASVEGIRHWDEFPSGVQAATLPVARTKSWRRVAVILLAVMLPISALALIGSWWKNNVPNLASIPIQPPLPSAKKVPPTRAETAIPSDMVAKSPEIVSNVPITVSAIILSAVEKRAPAGSGCGRLRLTGDPTVNSEITSSSPGGFDVRPAAGLCEVEFRVANSSQEPRTVWIRLSTTIDGAAPVTTTQLVPPGASLGITATADPWGNGKPWRATLMILDDLQDAGQIGNEMASLGVDAAVERLNMLGFKPKVLTYNAEATKEPRFR
jgi:hypothetical protein